jgi:enoyl-CoA hydratase
MDKPAMIDLKTENGIAVLTIRHGKANALDGELCDGLAKSFQELRTSDARAVVMTGQGRIFSAGVDLLRVSSGGTEYVRAFLPTLHRLYDEVFFHPKPVVAAINGHAIAGGCVLACCGDRRIMARGGGRIGVTELLVGVPFPALAFEIVRFAVPRRHLPEFTYGGATYDIAAAWSAAGWTRWWRPMHCCRAPSPRRKSLRDCRRRLLRRPRSSFAKRSASAWSGAGH